MLQLPDKNIIHLNDSENTSNEDGIFPGTGDWFFPCLPKMRVKR
jgi:hypothetical protein